MMLSVDKEGHFFDRLRTNDKEAKIFGIDQEKSVYFINILLLLLLLPVKL